MSDDCPRLAPGARLRTDPLTGSALLLFPEGVLRLNRTGATILELCDGRTPLPAIAETLARHFGAGPADVLEDVTAFMAALAERGLLAGASAQAAAGASPPAAAFPEGRPLGLLAEVTYRCPLHCPYCSNPTRLRPGAELTTAEWQRVLTEAAEMGVLQVHFSGGEPLLRPDLPELIGTARAAGLYTNLLTSGIPLTPPLARRLHGAGLDHVQISFQGDEAAAADAVAGAAVHHAKLTAARLVRRLGWPLTVNVVLHRGNAGRVPALVALAEELDAQRLELANVQFYGWAHDNRAALLPAAAELEEAGRQAAAARVRLRGRLEVLYVTPDALAERPKACMGGWGRRQLTVNPPGDVLPCPTAGCITGLRFDNVRQQPLRRIWDESEAFTRFRGTGWMPQPCRDCDRREIDFGGCRCQAFLLTGDATATDPACALSPHRHLLPRDADSGARLLPLRLRTSPSRE
jgi:pyrroloquinoline quinone biosynthesis protein E